MLVKILGAIDVIASFSFMMAIFGLSPFAPLLLFSAGLLFIKGLFIIGGDVLSVIDIIASACLILLIFLSLPGFLLWVMAFLLVAKGLVSFI